MDFDRMFSSLNVTASALNAERMRMNVVANNLAKANVSAPPGETPPARETIFFRAVLDRARSARSGAGRLGGVEVAGIRPANEQPRMVADPGHPHANEQGFVAYPNINVADEMVNLISSSRSYGANLAVLKTFREMMLKTLSIGRQG